MEINIFGIKHEGFVYGCIANNAFDALDKYVAINDIESFRVVEVFRMSPEDLSTIGDITSFILMSKTS